MGEGRAGRSARKIGLVETSERDTDKKRKGERKKRTGRGLKATRRVRGAAP